MDALKEVRSALFLVERDVQLWEALLKDADKLHFIDLENAKAYLLDQGKYSSAATAAGRQA
jgi:hypothetical protein